MGRWKSLAVRMVGKALQKALFGDLDADDAPSDETPPADPFAKLKAAEAEKKEREREKKR